jgi:hypothetical protein
MSVLKEESLREQEEEGDQEDLKRNFSALAAILAIFDKYNFRI